MSFWLVRNGQCPTAVASFNTGRAGQVVGWRGQMRHNTPKDAGASCQSADETGQLPIAQRDLNG
jgi:hypothetical protein